MLEGSGVSRSSWAHPSRCIVAPLAQLSVRQGWRPSSSLVHASQCCIAQEVSCLIVQPLRKQGKQHTKKGTAHLQDLILMHG